MVGCITDSMAVSLSIVKDIILEVVKDKGVWRAAVHEVAESDMTERLNNSNNKRGGGGERPGSASEGQVWRGGGDIFPETKRKAERITVTETRI